jgi:hypothetical protein
LFFKGKLALLMAKDRSFGVMIKAMIKSVGVIVNVGEVCVCLVVGVPSVPAFTQVHIIAPAC